MQLEALDCLTESALRAPRHSGVSEQRISWSDLKLMAPWRALLALFSGRIQLKFGLYRLAHNYSPLSKLWRRKVDCSQVKLICTQS